MSLLVKQAIAELRTAIMDAAGRAVADGEFPAVPLSDFNVEVPANRDFGDYSANAAMAWARDLHCAPRKIAQALIDRMELCDTFFERCEVAGAGFLNFYLRSSFNACIIQDILEKGDSYGRSDYGRGKKINVEFVSANPTGPMHMGNARGGALGDCLAAVLDFAGYDVSREFYVNDAGNQIAKFGLSLDIRYQQLFLGEDAVQLPEDSYHGEDIIERAKEFAAVNGDKYMSASEQERRQALIDFALPKNIAAMKENMAKYRINYDTWFLESTLHNDGELEETLNIMRDKGLTYEKDGALWYKNKEVLAAKLREQGKSEEEIERLELKDEVLIRTNGNPTYFAADIAYHRNKFIERGFDRVIDVWGADHHGHAIRFAATMRAPALGLEGRKLDFLIMQMVRLMRGDEIVKVSKRTGKALSLADLMDEIGVDACRFFFNAKPDSHLEFDLDLAIRQDSENPVYYVQYAHARICSILKKMESEGVQFAGAEQVDATLLTEPSEMDLIRMLAAFPQEIVMAAEKYDPSRINRFVIDLASAFHRFYGNCRIQGADPALQQARLALCIGVKNAIFNVLTMFKINVPEKM